jgi:tetratricopeptide (TPR) repeat protein
MDYLTYAYLQRGRFDDAAQVLKDLRSKPELQGADFKVGYAATAMPVRYAIERQKWDEAAKVDAIAGAAPHVAAIAYWARALGFSRGGDAKAADAEIVKVQECLEALKSNKNGYWAIQTHVLLQEAQAWKAHASGENDKAVSLLRAAADEEDSVEKLPVTPGPIVPAREQLGEMLLALKQPKESLQAFEAALVDAPGRRGALTGAALASEQVGEKSRAEKYRAALR